MSKLSFRARALDATKAMPVYRKDEVDDLPDYSVLNRAVPQMPTGMEKEEESEHHLQRAISAQQVYGDKKVMVIPVPEAEVGVDYYNNIYKKQFRLPKQYIHNQAQALNSIMEQEKPDYDMDSGDESWIRDTNKRTGLEIRDLQFEEMIDRLEKSCGNQTVSLQEAKLLLKEDDDLIKAVYEYWLQKRAKSNTGALTYQVRQEKRDGSSSGDSYVAFRRRTEKMQTRKNRKNDEASYEKMLKLRRDLTRAVTILEMIKRRERCKLELLHLTLEIVEKRYQMKDWDGKSLKMARREVAIGHGNLKAITGGRLKHLSGTKATLGANAAIVAKQRIKTEIEREKRRKSKKNKEKIRLGLAGSSTNATGTSAGSSAVHHSPLKAVPAIGATPKSPSYSSTFTYEQAVDTMRQYEFHSSDEETSRPKSPISGSVAPIDERKKNPDGLFAFRRKPGCKYEAPRDDLVGDHWPWMTDDRHRYSLTTLTVPEKCMGFCRRRVGRGGRVLLDRAYTPHRRQLSEIDLHPESNHLPHNQSLQQLFEEIKHGRWRRYRPYNLSSHKAHKLSRRDNRPDPSEIMLQPFGHSIPASGKHSTDAKVTNPRTDSSDSETVDIMTTDENLRADLLHKRLLQKSPHMVKSQGRNKTTSQKRMLDSSPQKTKVKGGRSHQLKLSVVSSSAVTMPNNVSTHSAPVGMTLIGTIPGASPGKYNISNLVASPISGKSSPTLKKGKQTISRFSLDQAKFFGVKGQESVHATLMPVSSLQTKSTVPTSVTLTVTGPSPKVSVTPTALQTVTTTAGVVSQTDTVLTSSYSISSSSATETSSTSGTVFITPTTRIQQSNKTNLGKIQVTGSVPLTLSTVNSTTLLPPQYKQTPQGVLLGSQSLNLALTPATPQKHATLSQLSIPNSSGHASAILIAAPASGTLASSLPSHANVSVDGANSSGTTLTPGQAKTVSINVARVQTSSSGVGQIFTLQQHPDGNIGTLTVTGSQAQNIQHSGPAWVASGSGPNILKLGPSGMTAGIQIHPVTAGFKKGTNNKSLTVISKRPRVQQTAVNARTISIGNSKQTSNNNSKVSSVTPQITLVPHPQNPSPKPVNPHQSKNNTTVVLSKNIPAIEQPCTVSIENNSPSTPTPLSAQSENIVTDAPGLNNKTSKSNQPMEVT